MFQVFFMFRRLLFGAILVFSILMDIPIVITLQAIIFLNLATLIFHAERKSFIVKAQNNIELFNEFAHMQVSILFLSLTQIKNDGVTLAEQSLFIVYITGLLWFVNVLYVCKVAFSEWMRKRQLKHIRETKVKLAILQKGMNKLSEKKGLKDGKAPSAQVFAAPKESELTPRRAAEESADMQSANQLIQQLE